MSGHDGATTNDRAMWRREMRQRKIRRSKGSTNLGLGSRVCAHVEVEQRIGPVPFCTCRLHFRHDNYRAAGAGTRGWALGVPSLRQFSNLAAAQWGAARYAAH